jgi:hypothetical protein
MKWRESHWFEKRRDYLHPDLLAWTLILYKTLRINTLRRKTCGTGGGMVSAVRNARRRAKISLARQSFQEII